MDKNIIKPVIGFVLGGVTGALIAKKVINDNYEAIIDEEVESVKGSMNKKIKMLKESEEAIAEMNSAYLRFFDRLGIDVASMDLEELEELDADDIEYRRLTSRYAIVDEDELFDKKTDIEENHAEPYSITAIQFANEKEDYNKITLTYYEGDASLVDENGEVVSILDTIGDTELSQFSDDDNVLEEVIYVRNCANGTDYEIIKNNLSYSYDILGFRK